MTEAPILLAFAAGLVSFLSPCIIPMISVYLTLITGMSLEELTGRPGAVARRAILLNTLLFSLGFTIVFAVAGGAAGWIGALLTEATRTLEIFGGVVVLGLGLSMAGLLKLDWLHKIGLPIRRPQRRPRGLLGSFGVGLFFAVACSHCIAPTLLAMLTIAGMTGTVSSGIVTMLAFSLGLTAMYMLTALAISPVLSRLGRHRGAARAVHAGAGVLIAAFGLLMVLGEFTRLSELASRLIPFHAPVGM
ncbi:MAG TPA: cytochrome c biogenesis protein CcdA [Thermoleophilia bacterium]|nr:cytochrome c biogenesis protein CcdA [Thermoleophilia bacterium]